MAKSTGTYSTPGTTTVGTGATLTVDGGAKVGSTGAYVQVDGDFFVTDGKGNKVSVIDGKIVIKTADGQEIVLPDFIVELQKEIKTMKGLQERIRTLERLLEGDLDAGSFRAEEGMGV
jgi:hypothetical protein